jgi:hypothetical protein
MAPKLEKLVEKPKRANCMDVKEYYMFGCCTFIYANKS